MNQFDINLIFLNLPEIYREVKEVCRVGKQYIFFDFNQRYGFKEYSVEACDKLI